MSPLQLWWGHPSGPGGGVSRPQDRRVRRPETRFHQKVCMGPVACAKSLQCQTPSRYASFERVPAQVIKSSLSDCGSKLQESILNIVLLQNGMLI
ncbi:hypothetical protein AVEN_247115-1 [Araneus ventricosus]|uniref:Uncharacterized protein n=1 Tax=Araneus ventricosus TaxID=182803 RepID=A0A4Y2TP26_ARAVE|nr:hypothetical protein AVEN_247115-1 [Araneus ventricosus]